MVYAWCRPRLHLRAWLPLLTARLRIWSADACLGSKRLEWYLRRDRRCKSCRQRRRRSLHQIPPGLRPTLWPLPAPPPAGPTPPASLTSAALPAKRPPGPATAKPAHIFFRPRLRESVLIRAPSAKTAGASPPGRHRFARLPPSPSSTADTSGQEFSRPGPVSIRLVRLLR